MKIMKSLLKFGSTPEVEVRINTQAQKKIWNYFGDLTEDIEFQKMVKNLRKKYQIPSNGFDKNEFKYKHRGEIFTGSPESVYMNKKFNEDIDMLANKFSIYWTSILRFYVIFNIIKRNTYDGMISVLDLSEYINGPFKYPIEEIEMNVKFLAKYSKKYPLAIVFNPYVSQRDIIDYIKKLYKISIKPLQDKYKRSEVKIGKFKTKKRVIKERNDFIYKNKDLPRKKIMSLVYDKFGENANIDYGYIGKIISMEKKKRKDV